MNIFEYVKRIFKYIFSVYVLFPNNYTFIKKSGFSLLCWDVFKNMSVEDLLNVGKVEPIIVVYWIKLSHSDDSFECPQHLKFACKLIIKYGVGKMCFYMRKVY